MPVREMTSPREHQNGDERITTAMIRHDRRYQMLVRAGVTTGLIGLLLTVVEAMRGDRERSTIASSPVNRAGVLAMLASVLMLAYAVRQRERREALRGRYVPGLEPPGNL